MVVIEIEDKDGSSIGAFRLVENNEYGEAEITDFESHVSTNKSISYADSDLDYFFNTNEEMFRIQLDYEDPKPIFRSSNYIGFYHENEEVKHLVQELSSYRRLLESFSEGDYYNCGVLIENYFGHIDYWYHFGYAKTHAEIVSILYTNMLFQITNPDKNSFVDFCQRQINKIIGRLEDDYKIEDVEQCIKDGWLP